MGIIIGRYNEINKFSSYFDSQKAQFIAVYGRRRIGKTFLIREFFRSKVKYFFFITGQKDAPTSRQLQIFQAELEQVFFAGQRLPLLRTWDDAFNQLLVGIQTVVLTGNKDKIVIFLDEIPWLATARAKLLQTLEHFWNSKLQYLPQVLLIICGSAASWIIKHVVNAKGGLHNRITGVIHLQPFSLKETQEFLRSMNFTWSSSQILEAYLTFGGVPYYLSLLDPRLSVAQNIAQLCFYEGELSHEFSNVFSALFGKSSSYLKIVRALASNPSGLTRQEISAKLDIPSSKALSLYLQELCEAGFIQGFTPFGQTHSKKIYFLVDEFSHFAIKWIENAMPMSHGKTAEDAWLPVAQSQSYRIWAGFAFERVCLKHYALIQHALGFSAVRTWVGPARIPFVSPTKAASPTKTKPSQVQIDLLFDRADQVMTIVEAKYHQGQYSLDREAYTSLLQKKDALSKSSKSKKDINFALITRDEFIKNNLSEDLNIRGLGSEVLFAKI